MDRTTSRLVTGRDIQHKFQAGQEGLTRGVTVLRHCHYRCRKRSLQVLVPLALAVRPLLAWPRLGYRRALQQRVRGTYSRV